MAQASPCGSTEPIRDRTVAIAAGRARCLDRGPADGRAVLLIHGLGCVSDEIFAAVGPALVAAGHRVLAVDRPGYGGSDALESERIGPAAQADWLVGVLRALDADVAVVVAHSFGAAVALYLGEALGRPLEGLVLVNPFCRPTPPARAPLMRLSVAPGIGPVFRRRVLPAFAEPLVRRLIANAFAPDPPPATLDGFPPAVLAQESAVLAMVAELRAYNVDVGRLPALRGKIARRVLALSGANDRVIAGRSHGEWLRTFVPSVEHRCVEAGHMLHHVRPGLIAEAVQAAA